jgi:hypothetical protein
MTKTWTSTCSTSGRLTDRAEAAAPPIAVVQAGVGADDFQHPLGAVVVQVPAGILQQIDSHAGLDRRGGHIHRAGELSARRTRAEGGQHDEAHQRTGQLEQRPRVRLGQLAVEHTQHATDDSVRRKRWRVGPRRRAFVVEDAGETIEHLPATVQPGRTRLRGMDDEVPGERRLLVEELEERPQARADTVEPAVLRLERRGRPLTGEPERLLERLQLTPGTRGGSESQGVLLPARCSSPRRPRDPSTDAVSGDAVTIG